MLPAEKIKLIESCLLKAAFDMLSDHDIVKEFERLVTEESKRRMGCLPPKDWTWEQSFLNFKFHRYSQLDHVSRVSFEYDNKFLCSFDCVYSDERYGCIIRYKTIEKAAELGICILYYEGKSDTDVFEYSADGLNTKLVFKPIVNLIRNTINYELYQQFPKYNAEEAKKQQQEKVAEALEKTCTELEYRKDVMTFWTQRHRFASVVQSIISETLDQFCSAEYDKQHELLHQYVRYLMCNKKIDPNAIDWSRYHYLLTTGDNNASLKFDIVADGEITRRYSFMFETSPVMIASIVVESHDCKSPLGYCDTTDIILRSHFEGHKEPKEVTTICQLQRDDDGAIQLIRCFDPTTTCGPYICEELFLAFHAVIGHSVATPALLQETCEESKEETMDTETKTTAVKPGLTTKEVFTLDENFFKSGDIYLLHISPKFHGDIHNGTALAPDAHLPSKVYAICTDTNGGTAIEFLFKPEEPLVGIRDLVYIQIHAEDIENGLIKVTRKLCNEALNLDKECNRYEG